MDKFDIQTSFQISVTSLIDIFKKTIENIRDAYYANQLHFVLDGAKTLEQRLKEIEYKYFIYYS